MASKEKSTPPLKRAGTMDVTALEGSVLLSQQGTSVEETADHLRSGHVFKTPEHGIEEEQTDGSGERTPGRGQLHRTSTIQATIQDSKEILGASSLGKTRTGDTSPSPEDERDGGAKRAPLQRTPTMAATIEDSKQILGDEKLGRTRGQDSAENDIPDHADGAVRRPPLVKTYTMVSTLEDAKHILGEQDLGRTRLQDPTAEVPETQEDGTPKRPPLQRKSTIAATVEDAKRILGEEKIVHSRHSNETAEEKGVLEGAKREEKKAVTISEEVECFEQTERGTLKRTHTMAETIEEGEDLLKRKKI